MSLLGRGYFLVLCQYPRLHRFLLFFNLLCFIFKFFKFLAYSLKELLFGLSLISVCLIQLSLINYALCHGNKDDSD